MQVPPDHVKRIPELVKGKVQWHIIPNMNHILRKYEGQHTMLGLMKEYKAQINETIDQDLLDKLRESLVQFKK